MKAHYNTESGRISFELEAESTRDMFRLISEVQAAFEADATCGNCGSGKVVFRVRVVDSNEFYELYCAECTAALSFGQTRVGNALYAKRRDDNGTLPNGGWKIWRPTSKGAAPAALSSKGPATADDMFCEPSDADVPPPKMARAR